MRLLLLVQAYLLLLIVTLRLRFLSAQPVFGDILYTESSTDCASPANTLEIIEKAQWSLHQAECLFPFRIRCLERAVVLSRLLRRRRIPTKLQIGVKKSGQQLEAHAWVEYQGRPLNSSAEQCSEYLPLETAAKSDYSQ
jgi:hypothetical protein